jgi:hypothetical protein
MKTERSPDFFLSTAGELEDLAAPRACWIQGRLRDRVRDDHMLIKIDPPFIGQKHDLLDGGTASLLISGRYKGISLFPIMEWPCHIYVSQVLDQTIIETLYFSREQIDLIAWGMLFRTLEEASAHAKRFE